MLQVEMKPYKEYGVVNKKGVLFILMRDKDNQLYKLISITPDTQSRKYTPIKSLTKDYKMFEPTQSDLALFVR